MDEQIYGEIRGFLAAMAAVNTYPNHGSIYRFEEVALEADIARSLRAHFDARSWTIELTALPRWERAAEAAAEAWFFTWSDYVRFDPAKVPVEVQRAAWDAVGASVRDVCIPAFTELLAAYFADAPVEAWRVRIHDTAEEPGDIMSEEYAFLFGGRLFLLSFAWND